MTSTLPITRVMREPRTTLEFTLVTGRGGHGPGQAGIEAIPISIPEFIFGTGLPVFKTDPHHPEPDRDRDWIGIQSPPFFLLDDRFKEPYKFQCLKYIMIKNAKCFSSSIPYVLMIEIFIY